MQVVKRILIALVILVAALVVVGLFLPSSAHVERTTAIEAPQATVFALLNDFQRFNDWSPWYGVDPDTRYTYDGPDMGVGATMSWASEDPNVGAGSMAIAAADPPRRLEMDLDFGPQGTARAYFDLEGQDGATRVTWGFDTDFGWNLPSRYFGLLFDRFVGGDYEKGLANLKQLAEGLPKADFSDLEIGIAEVEPVTLAYVTTGAADHDGIGPALGQAYGQVGEFLQRHGVHQAGPPLSIHNYADERGFGFDAGIPVDRAPDRPVAEGSAVQIGQSYGGKVVRAVHVGPYDGLSQSYEKARAWLAVHALEPSGRSWEQYVSDPGETPEAQLVTHIYFPLE